MNKTDIRNAASIVLIRDAATNPKVLMGQRGHSAAFMPSKYVFPGGALDPSDSAVALVSPINNRCLSRLRDKSDTDVATPLVLAAIRELWEETGLLLGAPAQNENVPVDLPTDWHSFFAGGVRPSGDGLRFVFRAVTPPGRPRRFDARFFLADADQVVGSLDDFTHASDELSHLQWIALTETRNFDLPFITQVVLAEVADNLKTGATDPSVPFFYNKEGLSIFDRL